MRAELGAEDAGAPARARLARGALAAAAEACAARARASGALEPVATERHFLDGDGLRVEVRLLGALSRKRAAGARDAAAARDPFLPYEEALFVGDLSDTHLCLLNKFPVLERHLLVVTRRFEEQQSPLDAQDFEALRRCLDELDGLVFYNAGPQAGASQRHKHLQLVPLPLGPGPAAFPLAPRLADAPAREGVIASPSLPFRHALARVDALAALPEREAAAASLALYRAQLAALGVDPCRTPYNLLATRRWLWLVPRTRANWDGIPVNALGFAGALLAPDAAALARLRAAGPLAALRAVTLPARA